MWEITGKEKWWIYLHLHAYYRYYEVVVEWTLAVWSLAFEADSGLKPELAPVKFTCVITFKCYHMAYGKGKHRGNLF